MRCPNCAGEIPPGSRFCGICGRNITPAPVAAAAGPEVSMSLFELPGARRARAVKVAVVLAIDAVLLGAGVVMIVSYLNAREAKPGKGRPRIEVMTPSAGAAVTEPLPSPAAAAAPVMAAVVETAPEDTEAEEFTERVRIVVESHGAQLEKCYERAVRAAGPGDPPEGRIDVRFTLMPNGSAQDVAVAANTTGSDQLASCVADLFRSWSMPHGASRPIPLEWPVAFHPPA